MTPPAEEPENNQLFAQRLEGSETQVPGLDRLPLGGSVLVVLFGRIGDVIFTLPSILALKKARPDLLVDWLVEDRCADLLLGHPALRNIILFRRGEYSSAIKERQFAKGFRIIRDLFRTVRQESYGAVLDFQGLLKSGVATFLSRGKIKLGSPSTYGRMKEGSGLFSQQIPLDREGRHLVERHLLVVQALLGTPLSPEPLYLEFSQNEIEKVRSICGENPFVLLHPFASWETRNWSTESWVCVSREIAKRGFRIAIAGAGGSLQEKVKGTIEKGVEGGVLDLLGRLTLRELALAMALSEVVLAVDSGPMHLAAAMGSRVVALFGPTDPVRLGPFGPRLNDNGIGEMGRTGGVVSAELPCQPCMMRRCPIGTPCRDRLTPAMVLQIFEEVFSNRKKAGQARELEEIRA